MEDLNFLQKRWEEAYEAMPKLYEIPNETIVNFTLSEDTDTILFKEPWENFKLDNEDEEVEWRLSFFSISEDKPLGYLEYKEALEKLQEFSLIQSEERVLIRAMSLEELKKLGLHEL
ncbi:hypothetical protein YZ26_08205 [Campylobacter lari]|uniref:hypothetical protein n=1 Tax=Campylobacter sp. CNRCH_2007_0968H TaxID=2911598 RepID=UPI001285DAE5|nr:hypothetical protein [Campylobacter sp. CNRCH_2007_0968H]EAJ5678881.1 hypothetical protein [Campylobacter lari]EAK0445334.1 hypothetical protein [Campylobacter lari]EAK9943923.1 hypothetical protein [Campylobacter lari]MCV3531472.1 hypothetical protein [Campylobacter sp. CNRCH_2007_0968H]